MSITLSSPVSMSYAIVITFFVVVRLQRNDYCLVECTAKKIWTKATSTNGMWCAPELKRVRMVRLSVMVGHNISALNIHVSVLVPCK